MTRVDRNAHHYPLPELTFIGKSKLKSGVKEKEREGNPYLLSIIHKEYPSFQPNEYHHLRPGLSRVLKSAESMNVTPEVPIKPEELYFVKNALLDLLGPAKFLPVSWDVVEGFLEPSQPGVYFGNSIGDKRLGSPYLVHNGNLFMNLPDYEHTVPLIQIVPKTEVLPLVKYEAGKARIYGILPGEFQVIEMKYFINLKKHILDLDLGFGMTMQHGGAIKLFSRLRSRAKTLMGDWKGHDLNIPRLICALIDHVLISRVEMSDFERVRLSHYMKYMYACYMVFPNGDIYKREFGNMSGRFLTTIIATFANLTQHLIVYHRTFHKVWFNPTYDHIISEWNSLTRAFYGDDHVLGGDVNDVNNLFFDEQYRSTEFVKVGATLKVGSYLHRSFSTEDLIFLGFTVNDKGEVHFHDFNKVLATLYYWVPEEDMHELLLGLIALFPNDPKMYDFLIGVGRHFGLPPLPSHSSIKILWSGYHPHANCAQVSILDLPAEGPASFIQLWNRSSCLNCHTQFKRNTHIPPKTQKYTSPHVVMPTARDNFLLAHNYDPTHKSKSKAKPTMTMQKDFMSRPSIKGLPKSERERRWKQSQSSRQASSHGGSVPVPTRYANNKVARKSYGPQAPTSMTREIKLIVDMMTRQDKPAVRITPQMGAGNPTGLFTVTQIFQPTTCSTSGNVGRIGGLFSPTIGTPIILPENYDGEVSSLSTIPNLLVESTSEFPSGNWSEAANFETGTNTGSNVDQVDDAWILTQQTPSRAQIDGATAMTATLPFGTAPVVSLSFPASFNPEMGTSSGGKSQLILPAGGWFLILSLTGTGITNVTITGTTQIQEQANAAGTLLTGVYQIVADGNDSRVINATATTITASTVIVTDDPTSAISDFGGISTIRPVAMQVLATCIAPVLDRGGTLTAALLQQNDKLTRGIPPVSPNSPGSPFKWEELARYNLKNSVHSGSFEKGAYVWWVPQDVSNTEFVTPSQMCAMDYPSIAIAANYEVSGGGSAADLQPLRITVTRTFEYTSDSQALNLADAHVSYESYQAALRWLRTQPRAMENDEHTSWYRAISKGMSDATALGSQFFDQVVPLLFQGRNTTMNLI